MTREEEIIARAKEAEKETTFSGIVLKAKGVCSAYGIGFLEGAVWADKTMIDKACEYIRKDWWNMLVYDVNNFGGSQFNLEKTIERFRKAMEEETYD